jgi:hypothetical protein
VVVVGMWVTSPPSFSGCGSGVLRFLSEVVGEAFASAVVLWFISEGWTRCPKQEMSAKFDLNRRGGKKHTLRLREHENSHQQRQSNQPRIKPPKIPPPNMQCH